MFIRKLIFATLVMALSQFVTAMEMEYPELMIVPSAEDRLQEAVNQDKDSNFVTRNWQILTPATSLILSGALLRSDSDIDTKFVSGTEDYKQAEKDLDLASNLQIIAGLSWWGLSYYLDKSGYSNDLDRIKKMPVNSKKARLKKARYAEEALLEKYKMMKRFKWLLLATTIGLSQMESDSGGTTAKAMAAITSVSALVPVFFQHRYETNYLNYERYKNRIYGPVASIGFIATPDQKNLVPSLNLKLDF